MRRVNALANIALVSDNHPLRNGADVQFVGQPMCEHRSHSTVNGTADTQRAIAGFVEGSRPQPTRAVVCLPNTLPESFGRRLLAPPMPVNVPVRFASGDASFCKRLTGNRCFLAAAALAVAVGDSWGRVLRGIVCHVSSPPVTRGQAAGRFQRRRGICSRPHYSTRLARTAR